MKNLIITIVILLFAMTFTSAQITITPNPADNGICPNVATTFTVNNIPPCAAFTFLITSGAGVLSQSGNSFTVTSFDISQDIIVSLKSTATQTCAGIDKDFTIPVRSVSSDLPIIMNCPGGLVAGKSNSFTMSAELFYAHRGNLDPAEVAGYTWTISSGGAGWTLTTTASGGITGKNATIVTNDLAGATISVTGTSNCALVSLPNACTTGRFAEKPTINGAPAYVICDNKNDITLAAKQATTGLSGYTYTWNYGTWTGVANSTGSGAFVTPDGTSTGKITVTSKVGTLTSAPTVVTIPLQTIEPSTKVIGDPFLCESEVRVYKLDISQQSSSITSWSVEPSGSVQVSTGTGESASLVPKPGYTGYATISFNIATLCGTAKREFKFFVGKPIIIPLKVDGNPASYVNFICPNDGLGSHWISISAAGDETGCIDNWTSTGAATTYFNCDEFNFTLQYNPANNPPYNTVYATATASNACGTTTRNFVFIPSTSKCTSNWKIAVSPNPAIGQAVVELYEKTGGGKQEIRQIDQLEVLNMQGNIIQTLTVNSTQATLNLSGYQPGQYFIRMIRDGSLVIEQFYIQTP